MMTDFNQEMKDKLREINESYLIVRFSTITNGYKLLDYCRYDKYHYVIYIRDYLLSLKIEDELKYLKFFKKFLVAYFDLKPLKGCLLAWNSNLDEHIKL